MTYLIDTVALSKQCCVESIKCKLAYATNENLVGRVLTGYHPDALDIALLSPKAAQALCQVQNYLINQFGYGLFIFDAYRPKRAVKDFFAWSQIPEKSTQDLYIKQQYYPTIEKNKLFAMGYIAEDSGHCYGNTVDLVLMNITTQQYLDMGAHFDFMHEISHLSANPEDIGKAAFQHRKILREAMELFGFEPYSKEFWHFSHGGNAGREIKEALDIEITASLKGQGVASLLDTSL